ncbi:MAG: MFS transporter [Peptococcaceae bacterium]|nr:MFS transporter [Peptococcaceae bacterium]
MLNRLERNFPALFHKSFRYFWLGQIISVIGTWMQRTAQQWLVYSLTKSAFLLGLLGVAQFGPMLLFSLFAGVIIDRYSKKKILIITQITMMAQAVILAAIVWSGKAEYWQIIVLALVFGFLMTVDMPSRQSFVIELVGRKDLPNAIALNSSVFNFARIAGPALSAVLMARYGAALCFFLNGISFIPVIFSLILTKPVAAKIQKERKNIIAGIHDGIMYIWRLPSLRIPILALLAIGAFAINMEVIIPVFADRVLGLGVHGYGFLLSAMGFGSLIGALFVAARVRIPKQSIIFLGAFLICLFEIIASFLHNYYLVMPAVILIGFSNVLFLTSVNSIIQLNSSDEYRGRVMSVYALSNNGMTPLGNFFAGSIMEVFGASIGLFMCGGVAGILVILLLVWMGKSHHELLE